MAKKIVGFIKLQIPAGKANPSPPVGPALAQVREIAEQKMPDLNCSTVEAAMNMVVGQARSMGIEVVE